MAGNWIVDKIFLFNDVHDRVALLAFHMALITHPQHAFVILTFASVLYRANWKEAVKFAEKHSEDATFYGPEFSDSQGSISDDELAKKVAQLAVQVQKSINILADRDSLLEAMSKFPGVPCSGLVGKHTLTFTCNCCLHQGSLSVLLFHFVLVHYTVIFSSIWFFRVMIDLSGRSIFSSFCSPES